MRNTSYRLKKTLPLAIAGLTGLIMVGEGFLQSNELSSLAGGIQDWVIILAGFTLCLGSANVIILCGKDVVRRTPKKWYYSALLLIILAVYVAIGLILSTRSPIYSWLFNTINLTITQALFGLLAFYTFSSAIRAFQARNWEATLFLICAVFVVLGNVPSVTLFFPAIGQVGSWVTDIPGKGAFRGLLMAASVGVILLAIRTLMGRESAYLGRG